MFVSSAWSARWLTKHKPQMKLFLHLEESHVHGVWWGHVPVQVLHRFPEV